MADSWGYNETNGPDTWKNHFPAANGKRQSPIDLITKNAIYEPQLTENPIFVTISSSEKTGGQSLKVSKHGFSVLTNTPNSRLRGGPLGNDAHFELLQFHYHWSDKDTEGSEHLLNGQAFPSEVHFVFWNSKKYPKFEEAAPAVDGLAVLGFFIKIVEKDNEELAPLFDVLAKRANGDDSALKIDPPINLDAVVKQGDLTQYYTYEGSLTTPPCFESVQWFVFNKEMELSRKQLELLRTTHGGVSCGCGVKMNYRPPCPLHERKVRSSFKA